MCATYTHARRHPMVLGKIAGWTPPFQISIPQLGVIVGTFIVEMATWRCGGRCCRRRSRCRSPSRLPWVLAWAVRRGADRGAVARPGCGRLPRAAGHAADRSGGRPTVRPTRAGADLRGACVVRDGGRPVKPPARAIVGNLDLGDRRRRLGRVAGHARSRTPTPARADKLAVHSRLRGLLLGLPAQLDAALGLRADRPRSNLVDRHARGGRRRAQNAAWLDVCAGDRRLAGGGRRCFKRRYYVAAELPGARRPWLRACSAARPARCTAPSASAPARSRPPSSRRGAARHVRSSPDCAPTSRVTPATAGEICWLYARSLRREAGEPAFDRLWEPPPGDAGVGVRRRPAAGGPGAAHRRGREGGRLQGRPGPAPAPPLRPHRRAGRHQLPDGAGAWPTCPTSSPTPTAAGSGCTTPTTSASRSTGACGSRRSRNADAQAKVRRKQRDLIGQVDEYDGEVTGAPPQLAAAIQAIDDERAQLGANPMEPELQVTILMSIAADSLAELEDKAAGARRDVRAAGVRPGPADRRPGRPCCARCCPARRRRRCAATTRSSC